MTLAQRQRAAQRLQDSPTIQQVAGVSGEARTFVQPATLAKAFWQAFIEGAGHRRLVAERFDYDAVDLWLTSAECPVLADQSSLIRRLLLRRRTPVSTPLITAWEEQDPHFGRWTLATLLYEKYGEFKIQNNSYIHLNYPPTSLPPQEQRIHFCWGIGWEGATQPTAPADKRWSNAAGSVLNAVVALIIDDWRGALAPLPVRFVLHRMNPLPCESETGRRRRRWRLLEPPVPYPGAVAALFERVNFARTFSPWTILTPAVGRRDWWVACVFETDLRALGFTPDHNTLRPGVAPAWHAQRSGLPPGIEHVIVVPPKPDVGRFYRARRFERMTILEPQRSARTTAVATEDYLHLRVAALDLALNELSDRMH